MFWKTSSPQRSAASDRLGAGRAVVQRRRRARGPPARAGSRATPGPSRRRRTSRPAPSAAEQQLHHQRLRRREQLDLLVGQRPSARRPSRRCAHGCEPWTTYRRAGMARAYGMRAARHAHDARPMLLVVDVGNTQTHFGTFRGDELVEHWRFATVRTSTADELGAALRNLLELRGVGLADLTASIVSSTVPQLEPEWLAMASTTSATACSRSGPASGPGCRSDRQPARAGRRPAGQRGRRVRAPRRPVRRRWTSAPR